MIETIHFVGGLGGHEGRDLQPAEALAVELAHKHHPSAQVFLHTAFGTWSNYKSLSFQARRVQHWRASYEAWPNWAIDQGICMADKLRLNVLLSCQAKNALYLDTDAYCVRNLDWLSSIEGCAMARLGPFMVSNGLIYNGRDKSFLQEWYRLIMSATEAPPTFSQYVCRLPHELHQQMPGLTVLDNAKFHGVTGDEAMAGYWADSLVPEPELSQVLAESYVVHLQGPLLYEHKQQYSDPGSAYSKMLKLLAEHLQSFETNTID